MLITQNLLDSREPPIRALKGGQLMAESMGVDTFRSKLVIFLISAVFAAVSGWLYAHTQRFVNPPFGLNMGIDYLFMALIGGVGASGARCSAAASSPCSSNGCRTCCRTCWAAPATTRPSSSACSSCC